MGVANIERRRITMDAEKSGERMNREHDNETADSAVDPVPLCIHMCNVCGRIRRSVISFYSHKSTRQTCPSSSFWMTQIIIFFLEIKESKITRGHNYTLVKKQSRLDVRKYSFSQRTINVWNNLSTDCVQASSVNMFKNKIDKYLVKAGYT